jgi:hypothetical protein
VTEGGVVSPRRRDRQMNLTAEHIRQIERAIANGVPPRIIMYLWGVTRHEIAKIKAGAYNPSGGKS